MISARTVAIVSAGLASVATAGPAAAQDAYQIPQITVYTSNGEAVTTTGQISLKPEVVKALAARTNSTADLLHSIPGMQTQAAGGVSSLPILRGLNDDRLLQTVNGIPVSAACANHMNPPLSYVDPGQVARIDVYPGVTPVNVGGDNIGGVVKVTRVQPKFDSGSDADRYSGNLHARYRSNGRVLSFGGRTEIHNDSLSLSYAGDWARGKNAKDGNGAIIGSTEFEAQNHNVTLATRQNNKLLQIDAGIQHIPYQGYVNQAMDMTLNNAWNISGKFEGDYAWGKAEAQLYYHHTRHKMDFLDDKQNAFAAAFGGSPSDYVMPMDTRGQDFGYALKIAYGLSVKDKLTFGSEFHGQTLDDWWPPVAGSMMMCCDAFVNVNDGQRHRLSGFADWERQWSAELSSVIGARVDGVFMNAGRVNGYYVWPGDPDSDAADVFNASDRSQTDINFDFTAKATYEPSKWLSVDGGYARKTRSPSIYERYTWGRGDMSSQMVSWFGDVNGYFGDINLKPEVAHTLSATFGLHDPGRQAWEISATPYFTHVEDFITADFVRGNLMGMGFNQLQFANHDADLYGFDISGHARLGEVAQIGTFSLAASVGYVHGEDKETGGALYHMMPLNGRVALQHQLGGWSSEIEMQLVGKKSRVDDARLEPMTGAYELVNLRTSYQLNQLRVDAGVENLFDKQYELPLGGINYTDTLMPGTPVAGFGRSIYLGMSMDF